ncbi:StbB family protein [Acidovorax sp.]|uniref:StbB family protein n=1 Tax=Acidovorax sp. TaxID=1872122 RepID=UPI00391F488A
MKVAVINFSGNVGKTVIASHLLSPRMPDAKIFSVESINAGADADGLEVEKIRGKGFGALADELLTAEKAIIDVGASNVEDFLKMMQQYAGSHEDIDHFIIPVVKEQKVQKDTVNTIRSLQQIGVKRDRISVVFNRVDVDDNVQADFGALFGLAATERSFRLNAAAAIYSNEVYERMKAAQTSLGAVNADDTDYRAKLRSATTDDEKEHSVNMIAMKRLAISANENLDAVYKIIFK